MKFKEKELKESEDLFLILLDKSSAIQKKILSICSSSQGSDIAFNSSAVQPNDTKLGLFDKKKISSLEERIEQLKKQLAQCQSDYKQTADKMQEYKNYFEQLKSECCDLKFENSSLENKIARLENELKKVKTEFDDIEKSLRDYEHENARLKENEQTLSSSLTEANNNVRILKERFSKPVILLERYKSLSVSIRTGLSDVICDKDEILFITSCSTPEHLKAIWTYTKKLAGSNGDINGIEVLKDIFDYFFDVFNNSLREPMYIRDNVETGYSFNDDKYDRCSGSATSGKITQVIMKGYKSINTGTIICRSFVRV